MRRHDEACAARRRLSIAVRPHGIDVHRQAGTFKPIAPPLTGKPSPRAARCVRDVRAMQPVSVVNWGFGAHCPDRMQHRPASPCRSAARVAHGRPSGRSKATARAASHMPIPTFARPSKAIGRALPHTRARLESAGHRLRRRGGCAPLLAARRDLRITGIDLARIPAPADRRIALLAETPMERLPLDGSCCDAAVSQFGFEYGDVRDAARELARVLVPGATFSFLVHHSQSAIMRQARARSTALDTLLGAAVENCFLSGDAAELDRADRSDPKQRFGRRSHRPGGAGITRPRRFRDRIQRSRSGRRLSRHLRRSGRYSPHSRRRMSLPGNCATGSRAFPISLQSGRPQRCRAGPERRLPGRSRVSGFVKVAAPISST